MARHMLTVFAVAFVAVFGLARSQSLNYPSSCDMNDPGYQFDSSAPKLTQSDGYEIFIQVPVYAQVNQNIISSGGDMYKKLLYPINETFFIRAFGDQVSKGSMYIAGKHKMISLYYDKKINESMLVDYQYGSCDVQPMIYEPEYQYGYFHGTKKPIHVPFPDALADLTKFKIKKLDPIRNYRGFANVQRYETCINLRDMIIRVLSELDSISIPPELLQVIPDPVAVRGTWYFADQTWEMEDGKFAETGPVPLGIHLTGAESASVRIPIVGQIYLDLAINATMTMANYHDHYPPHDVFRDLLQVPVGVRCNRLNPSMGPEFPIFPRRFHIKTESLVLSNHSFVYNTEDYYDYDKNLFRFDVTLHRPDKYGPVELRLFHDYTNNIAYEINQKERTCKKKSIDEASGGGKWSDDPITHLIMRPYDIIDIANINPSYIGTKPCRGMKCHYWVGQKDLKTNVDGRPTYGVFGVWAASGKWTQNYTSSDPSIKHMIVELDVQVFDKQSKQLVARDHLQIFDYRQITGQNDLYFEAPTSAFCAGDDGDTQSPRLPWRYQYHGEYAEQASNSSTPIFLSYDVDWNVIRFDWTPTAFDQDGTRMQYRHSYIYDRTSSTNYRISRVTGNCHVSATPPEYRGEGIDPLHLIWPPTIHENVGGNNLKYVGVQPCRRMKCDSFAMEQKSMGLINITEYHFTTDAFTEVSSDNPGSLNHNVLARVARITTTDDGRMLSDELNSVISVDIYGYTDQKTSYWEYDVVSTCFDNVVAQYIRMHFTVDNVDALTNINNDYFRLQVMDAIRKNASNLTPLRIAEFFMYPIQPDRIGAEFKLRERHPQENFFGPSLHDAIHSLRHGISNGDFVISATIPSTDATKPGASYKLTADSTLEQCDIRCSAAQYQMPSIQLDIGALIGTIIGSVFAGLIVAGIILTVVISRKHQVPMQSLYVGTVPGTGVSADLPSVSMAGGIAVNNNDD